MYDLRHLMFQKTSDRFRSFVLCVALSLCFLGHFEPAAAQAPPIQQNPITLPVGPSASVSQAQAPINGVTPSAAQTPPVPQAPTAPPLYPPEVGQLPSGAGSLSFGQWLLSPALGFYTLYDSNLYSNPAPLSGPGIHIHPSLLAVFDTGIFTTSLYGSIDSTVYPTLNSENNTFNRQAGFIQNYAPLRDLTLKVQGDYTHSTDALAITNSLPNQLTSPATPGLPGAAGVAAAQETFVNPNDTFTGTATVYKEINRGFMKLSGSFADTQYEGSPAPGQFLPNFDRESYYGSGGYWLTPLFYAYTDGIQAFTNPVVGPDSNSSRARAGIGSAPIGLFRGSVYAGWQGSEVAGGGTAGGNIYGGIISYIPTLFWNVDFSVDRLLNVSNITLTSPQAQSLGGLQYASVGIPLQDSAQITSFTLSSNYVLSPQTSIFGVLNYTQIAFIGMPRVDDSWLATLGIRHRLTSNLTLSLDYQYTSYISPEPFTSFTRSLASVGAVYNF
jgi:hypothetical protein